MSRPLAVLVTAIALLAACGGGGVDYAADRQDADYDLPAMALQETDVPEGFVRDGDRDYDNEEYALLFDTDDTDAKKRQLDALGRVRSHMAFFSQDPVDDYSLPLVIFTSSTIFVDSAAAEESLGSDCGLPIELGPDAEDFDTKGLGDESSGFTAEEDDPFTHMNYCFRTGRLVHAVVLRGLRGTEDPELAASLAKAMARRVDEAFEGES